jgi:DNA-binding response OmpR family regulator
MALEAHYRFPVRYARDAAHAFGILGEYGAPVALITDLNLPDVDGFELIGLFRRYDSCARTPIIVLSADTHPGTPVRVLELGADAFFEKPCSPAGICLQLERILHAKNGSADSSQFSRPSGASPNG